MFGRLIVALMLVSLGGVYDGRADDPVPTTHDGLTGQIDHYLSDGWDRRGVQPTQGCTDREYLRRIFLDLAGRIPTRSEFQSYLQDQHADKRARWVDQLLASEDHVQHLTDVMDALLMGRAEERKYAERKSSHWRAYLEDAIRTNRPWNEVAAEILLARPDGDGDRGVIWFLYERNNDHQAIAESVAPAFFGIRIECAQCHDHMMVDEIKQEDYWGLVAFFNRSQNKKTKKGPRVAESAVGGFSEFADLGGNSYPNLLTFLGSETVAEERPKADEKQEDIDTLYTSASSPNGLKIPKFSRRKAFVERVVDGNPRLALAMVNRVWAILMGRGIVHPFDEMDSMHPPSHPELLDCLAEDFVANGYDIRRLVRAIALSRSYQLSSVRPDGVDDPASFAWYLERPLTAEQLVRSVNVAVRGEVHVDGSLMSAFRQQFRDVLPDTFVAPVADALHFSNHPALHTFLRESNDDKHLRATLLKAPNARERAELLFLTIIQRSPDASEKDAVSEYLQQRESNLGEAMDQVIWSLLTGAEFRLNH